MKKILYLLILVTLVNSSFAQSSYEITRDASGVKILNGIINKDLLLNDTAFKWFEANYKSYTPLPAAVNTLKTKGADIQFIVFGGTWCGDTHYLLPRFFGWLNAAGYDAQKVKLIGVDHQKKSIDSSTVQYKIVNVPTFIVMKGDKEIGRVVEYGKYSQPDKELAEIIEAAK